jgi:anti-sigma factor RsiW
MRRSSLEASPSTSPACHAIVTLKAFRGLPDRPQAACDAAVDAIVALADGVLDELGHRRLAVHLGGCAHCRVTALRVTLFKDEVLADVPEPAAAPVPALALAESLPRPRREGSGGAHLAAGGTRSRWSGHCGRGRRRHLGHGCCAGAERSPVLPPGLPILSAR